MANKNINTGPIIQFCTKESPSILVFLNTSPNSSYFTLANGGYIITINPIAIGILVVPDDKLFQNLEISGLNQPIRTPANMARNIQRVKYLSRNFNRFCEGII